MTPSIVFTGTLFERVTAHLFENLDVESMAMGFYRVSQSNHHTKLLVSGVLIPTPDDYEIRTPTAVALTTECMERCIVRCENENLNLLDTHTHPWSINPEYSATDNMAALIEKIPYLKEFMPQTGISFIVFGKESRYANARYWDKSKAQLQPISRIVVL